MGDVSSMPAKLKEMMISNNLVCGACQVKMRRIQIQFAFTMKGKQKQKYKGIGHVCTLCKNVGFDIDLKEKEFWKVLVRRDTARSKK